VEAAIDGARKGLGECRLADAGHVFDEQVAAREQADGGEADDFGFAAQDGAEGGFELRHFRIT